MTALLSSEEAIAIRVPRVSIPIALEVSPFTAQAEEHARKFVRRYGLVPSEPAKRRHDDALLGSLMGSAYPRGRAEDLELVTDWISCNLVLDDRFDRTELGRRPDAMRRECRRVIGWLPIDGEPGPDSDPFARAYDDLWRRTTERMSAAWCRRFVDHFSAFLDCCCWEADNRSTGRIPTPEVYRSMRGRALMPYLDLIELINHREIPEHIYRLPAFVELNQALSDADLWTNDIFSCVQEALMGDAHNFVVVYQHAYGTTFQSAVDAIAAMTQARINQFVQLADGFVEREIPHPVSAELAALLEAHLHTMRCWLIGQLQWRYDTKRFAAELPTS